jgi:ribulose kinase
MKHVFITFFLALLGASTVALAQERIYRCGNEYTNAVSEAQMKTCKLVSGGNVTVVQAPKSSTAPGTKVAAATASGQQPQRSDLGDQRGRDSDARVILEAELKKAESRQAELLKEYNNGEPEKLGPEARNHQKYLDRITELKANISRGESDIAGIRRELGRVPPSASSTALR